VSAEEVGDYSCDFPLFNILFTSNSKIFIKSNRIVSHLKPNREKWFKSRSKFQSGLAFAHHRI